MKLPFLTFFCGLLLMNWAHAGLSSDELFQLQAQQESRGVIYLDSSNSDQILNGPRDYYLSILFTTLDASIECPNCKKFDDKYKSVASSYYESNPGKDAIFFLIAEFTNNRDLYTRMKLNAVPVLWVYPPNSTLTSSLSDPRFPYTIGENALNDVLDFASFVSKLTGSNIRVNEPFDPSLFVQYFFGTFLFVLLLKKKVLSKIDSHTGIKFATTIVIILLTSGYMFTVIRGIPFISKNDQGEMMYFSGGTHWQFGTETFIVSGIYLALVLFIFALTVSIPKIENDKKRTVLTITTSFAIFYTFNFLTSIFVIKDPDYPYQLAKWL